MSSVMNLKRLEYLLSTKFNNKGVCIYSSRGVEHYAVVSGVSKYADKRYTFKSAKTLNNWLDRHASYFDVIINDNI